MLLTKNGVEFGKWAKALDEAQREYLTPNIESENMYVKYGSKGLVAFIKCDITLDSLKSFISVPGTERIFESNISILKKEIDSELKVFIT